MADTHLQVAVAYVHKTDVDLAKQVAQRWHFDYIGDIAAAANFAELAFVLQVNDQVLELVKLDEPKLAPIKVDFIDGAVGHRRKFGGGRGQDIAKAVGLKHGFNPHVLDATAGLGRDAFVLAALGCKVTLVERNPVVAALLADGLARAQLNADISEIAQRMTLIHQSSTQDMPQLDDIDVVYLDPMYPHKEKSAQVKKEMRVFQHLVGADLDADQLLAPALALAEYRVVVKRPSYADYLANQKPSTEVKMKKNRFDIYVNKGIPKPA
ncbi:class I SAM-dependent methyltransferase [Thalassotalea euphylliae]|uniref:Ribosomal RNA small subunit methyltransferase J n=1 Tax=Thalassotalea euphylliae TaxID=1655234 RepID=A0A3E0U3N0_9GAMM|nr:class I SAM-dependent methyltransferase [Thalassotalea euphylliae]REL31389.1 16S rRNA methyltransferase [Thalassotalea euphylliae]